MARYLIAFLLVILCCATNSFAAVTTNKWQQESTGQKKHSSRHPKRKTSIETGIVTTRNGCTGMLEKIKV
jgi:hypothetical protein